MEESVQWVAKAALDNATFQLQCADALERQASALLILLLGGAGGAMAYAVSLAEKGAKAWLVVGMGAASVWLCSL